MEHTFIIAQQKIAGIGTLWIATSGRKLLYVQLGGTKHQLRETLAKAPGTLRFASTKASPLSRKLFCDVSRYARGANISFRVPLHLTGTNFQQRVWSAIARIPWGETRSYAWLAAAAGRPRAVRAAANACGKNPIPILIPCHRVIASDGGIGGFSGGLALKRRLLAIEKQKG